MSDIDGDITAELSLYRGFFVQRFKKWARKPYWMVFNAEWAFTLTAECQEPHPLNPQSAPGRWKTMEDACKAVDTYWEWLQS